MRLGSLDEFAVIVGGESGPRARPCQLEWVESIRDQCFEADVPPFVKQLGAKSMDRGYRFPLKDSKGGDWNEWPKDLRVREMPATGSASLVGQTA
jgi:protein gp37